MRPHRILDEHQPLARGFARRRPRENHQDNEAERQDKSKRKCERVHRNRSLLLNFHRMVEQIESKRDTRRLQPLAKLRHDARGVEPPFDISTWTQPQLLERINVLKAYD